MLKVVHIISGDLWAGAEAMAYSLVREQLGSTEIDVSVCLLNGRELADKLRKLPVNLVLEDEKQHRFPQLLHSVRRWLNHHQPHIIHSHRYKENIISYLASLGGRQPRLLSTQHGLPEADNCWPLGRDWLFASMNRSLLRYRFDKVVGVSNNIYDYLKLDCGIQARRLTVINNGIDLPPALSSSVLKDQLVIGSAGRLFPVKDYLMMIKCAQSIKQVAPDALFLVAGDGPEKENLRKEITERSLDGIFSLLGHLDDISTLYGRINIYINTSLHEGIPMSILEAMAHGLPVVAPDVGGISEIIEDGVDGFLVKERTPEAFAWPIKQLSNPDLRQRIGKAAIEKIRCSFSSQRMAEQYYQLYKSLVE